MYKINDIFYDNEEYSTIVKFCNNNNLIIVEIDSDENGRRFQIQEKPKPSEKEQREQEYNNLLNWFDYEYTYKEQKYRRLITLEKPDDDGINANVKLQNLYIEAEQKRLRIQQLEKLLN